MQNGICRWGIMGTATIARKNWQAIRKSSNATLAAVASRDRQRSEAFIADCQAQVPFQEVPRVCGSYAELIDRNDIDAVYIPLPTGIRKDWVIQAAAAGKHVLCEKPCGVTAGDVEEMIAACDQNKVQFMDGVMFMHSQRLPRYREVIDDGDSLGEIKRVTTNFTFCAPGDWLQSNIRTTSDLEPLGCLGDLGWYTIRFSLFVMNYEMPQRVSGRMLSELGQSGSPSPVPVEFSGELLFSGGVSAGFYCSFLTEHCQLAQVCGSKGYLQALDFVLPYYGSQVGFDVANTSFELDGCDFLMKEHTRHVSVDEHSNSTPDAQETMLFKNFSELVVTGQRDSFWPTVALKTQKVMDACLASARSGGTLLEP